MKIAVNTRLLLPGKLDGIGWFSYHTLKRITNAHPEVEFLFFFDRKWSDEFIFSSNVKPVALFPQARHPFLYYWWFEYSIPAALKKYNADLFLSPDGYLSLSTSVKQLGVVHDINFEHYPKDLPWMTRNYYLKYFPKFCKKATRLATVSEFSKNDLVNTYQISPNKIDVVYNGVNEIYQPLSNIAKEEVKNKYTNGFDYFLFVGMLHQRKNIANLLKAFDEFKEQQPNDIKLLIVGNKKWWTEAMEDAFSNMTYRDDVIFAGRLSIEELAKVTASAYTMVYVSVFEGFGVPIIESMKSGVPVITSNVTSMPEVSADAALLVDPFQVSSIANGMIEMWSNESLRNKLIEKGLLRSADFNWDKSADLLWQSITKALEE